MAKIKPSTAKRAKIPKNSKKDPMDKVKIKRVKRNKKKITTKEKVLAGLGLGSTLLGGASAIAPQPKATQFVRTQTQEESASKSKVKDTLKKIFKGAVEKTVGVSKAKAAVSSNPYEAAEGGGTYNAGSDLGVTEQNPDVGGGVATPQAGDTKPSDDGQYTLVYDGSNWNPAPGSSRQSTNGDYREYWNTTDNTWHPANGAVVGQTAEGYDLIFDEASNKTHIATGTKDGQGKMYIFHDDTGVGEWVTDPDFVPSGTGSGTSGTGSGSSTSTGTGTTISGTGAGSGTSASSGTTGTTATTEAPPASTTTYNIGDHRPNPAGYEEYYYVVPGQTEPAWYPANGAVVGQDANGYDLVYDATYNKTHIATGTKDGQGKMYIFHDDTGIGEWAADSSYTAPATGTGTGGTGGVENSTGTAGTGTGQTDLQADYGTQALDYTIKDNGDGSISVIYQGKVLVTARSRQDIVSAQLTYPQIYATPEAVILSRVAYNFDNLFVNSGTGTSLDQGTRPTIDTSGSREVWRDEFGNSTAYFGELGGRIYYDAATGRLYQEKADGSIVDITNDNAVLSPEQRQQVIATLTAQPGGAGPVVTIKDSEHNLLTELGVGVEKGDTHAPTESSITQGTWGPVFRYGDAYGSAAMKPSTLDTATDASGQKIYTFTFTNDDGKTVTRTFVGDNDLDSFLSQVMNNFSGASRDDQILFAAAINAKASNPEIGFMLPGLPASPTDDHFTIRFMDANGNWVEIPQGLSPNFLSTQEEAEYLQKLFPGSTVQDQGYGIPYLPVETKVNIDPNDPRKQYALVMPDGSTVNVGLLRNSMFTSLGQTLMQGDSSWQQYFNPPADMNIKLIPSTYTGQVEENSTGNVTNPTGNSNPTNNTATPPQNFSTVITHTAAFDKDGDNSNGVVAPGYTIEIGGMGLTVYSKFILVIGSQEVPISKAVVSENKITLTVPDSLPAGLRSGDAVKIKVTSSDPTLVSGVLNLDQTLYYLGTAPSGDSLSLDELGGNGGNLQTVVPAGQQIQQNQQDLQNQQTIANLQRQVSDLQNTINTLNSQSGSGSVTGDSARVANLQAEVQRLNSVINTLQNGNFQSYGSVTGMANFQGLQMPQGYPASGPSSGSFEGLKMPAGYPASDGLKMPPGYPASGDYTQVQGVATQGETLGTYTVKKGDTVWNIAKKYYGDGRKWRKILEANTGKVKNPNTMKIGIELVIPKI